MPFTYVIRKEKIKATDSNNSLCYKTDQYRIWVSSFYFQAAIFVVFRSAKVT